MRKLTIRGKEQVILFLLKLVSLLNLVLFVFSSDKFYNDLLFSVAARMLLIVNVTILLLVVAKVKHTRHFFVSCMILLFMVAEAYVSYILNPAGSIKDFVILLAGYLAVPIYLLTISYIHISKTAFNWMKSISWVYIGFFLLMSIAFPSYRKGTNALMLGYSNSNRTGVYMLLVIILSVLVSYGEEKKMLWCVRKGCEAVVLYFIAATQSRTSFILALLAEVASLLPLLPKIGKKTMRICILAPALFLLIYVYAYEHQWFMNAELLGKTIYSGRQVLFVTETLPVTFFGNYALGQFAGLNVAQSILNTLGIFGLILYYLFYFRLINSSLFTSKDRRGAIAVICFALLMLHGCTEKALMISGSVYAGMMGCILVAIKANNNDGE